MKVVYSTLKDISILTVLFSVFIFIYMLIGMELYANRVTAPEYQNASNFNNLLDSFLTVFIIIANDGWSTIFFSHYRSTNPYSSTLYFVSLLIIGQMILVNLIIAIIIENFEFLSVKNDLIRKLNNMQEGQSQFTSIWQAIVSYVGCFKKKSF